MFFSKAPATREAIASKVEEAYELQGINREVKFRFGRMSDIAHTLVKEYLLLPTSLQNRDMLIVLESVKIKLQEASVDSASNYKEFVCACVDLDATKRVRRPDMNCTSCHGCGLTKAGLKNFGYGYEE